MSNDWLDFIAKCRQGEIHNYDIVEGSMADDTIWNYVNDFLYGDITREQFWELAKMQISNTSNQFSYISRIKLPDI